MHSLPTLLLLLIGALASPLAAIPTPGDLNLPLYNPNGPCDDGGPCGKDGLCPLGVPCRATYLNRPICTSNQARCLLELGAMCLHQSLTFPAVVDSGNPDNCGNLCRCERSRCPVDLVPCGDPACKGEGSMVNGIGRCGEAAGEGLAGCSCK